MPIDFLNHLNLNKNQLQNVVIHPLGTAPPNPVEGQMYTDTTNGVEAVYAYLGSTWISLLNSTTVSVTDESTDDTCFPLFVTAATGDLAAKSGTNLTFNSNTGLLSATNLAGILDSGSITSGFGGINNGTGGITTNTFTASTSYVANADNAVALGTSSVGFADLFLSDSGEIQFGADQDVKLTHVPDVGLTLANTNTGDDKPIVFQLKSTESAVQTSEVIGSIEFAATDTSGTDATGVCAGIHAIATSNFSATSNPTKLVFTTGESEAADSSAAAKMTLYPSGSLTVAHDLTLDSDSSIISLGVNNDFTITHDGTTGATIVGNPVNITAGGASTWKTTAGAITIDSEAAAAMLDGHTGVAVVSATGEVDITATAGDIDINAGDNVLIDAADNIYLTTTSADGLLKLHSAHTAGQAILIDANANAGSILDIDAGILDIDIQGVASIDSGDTLSLGTANSGVAVTIGHTTSEVTIGDNLTVTGDLTVSGTTTTVNTATLTVEDPLIKLASGNNAADVVDIGFYGLYDNTGSQDVYTGLTRDASDDKWHLWKLLQAEPSTTVNHSGTGYAVDTLVANLEGNVTGVAGSASAVAADDITAGDAAVSIATSTGNVTVDSNAGSVTVDGHTGVTLQSTNSGDITLDSVADIVLDAGGNDIKFKAGGSGEILRISNSSSDVVIKPTTDAKDIIFQQYDGTEVARVEDDGSFTFGGGTGSTGATITGAGAATFDGAVIAEGFNVALAKSFALGHAVTDVTGSSGAADGNSTSFVVTHGFPATKLVKAEVLLNSGNFDTVFADVTRTADSTITISFASAVAESAYIVLLTRVG